MQNSFKAEKAFMRLKEVPRNGIDFGNINFHCGKIKKVFNLKYLEHFKNM